MSTDSIRPLTDSDVHAGLDAGALRGEVARCLTDLGSGAAVQFPKQSMPMPGGGFYLTVAGVVPRLGLSASKWASYRAGAPGVAGISTSLITVTDITGGGPRALLSGRAATHARTAATAAAIAERLAPDATTLALVGFGPTNRWTLEALRLSHPLLETVRIAVRSEASRDRLAAELGGDHLEFLPTVDVARAVAGADLAVSATGSRGVVARVADLAANGVTISLDGPTWDTRPARVVTDRAADQGTERDLTRIFTEGPTAVRGLGERVFVDTAGSAVTDVALAAVLLDGVTTRTTEGAPPCE